MTPLAKILRRIKAWCLVSTVAVFCVAWSPKYASAANLSLIPFVGCAGFGMFGPPAPSGEPVQTALPIYEMSKLAIYVGEDLTILAPRGWECSGSDGPNYRELRAYPSIHDAHATTGVVVEVRTGENPTGNYYINSYGNPPFFNGVYL